jgi:hypothetical protein
MNYPLESAAIHLHNNKFVSIDGWWPDNSAQCLLNIHNQAGPLVIEIKNMFVDRNIPMLYMKGQNEPAKIIVRCSNLNREREQILGIAVGSPLTVQLEGFDHQATDYITSRSQSTNFLGVDKSEVVRMNAVIVG